VPGLWASSILFFAVNVGILGIIIRDIRQRVSDVDGVKKAI
jgi:phosphatidylinositol glycan class M